MDSLDLNEVLAQSMEKLKILDAAANSVEPTKQSILAKGAAVSVFDDEVEKIEIPKKKPSKKKNPVPPPKPEPKIAESERPAYDVAKMTAAYQPIVDEIKLKQSLNKSIWTGEPLKQKTGVWTSEEPADEPVISVEDGETSENTESTDDFITAELDTAFAENKSESDSKGFRKTLVMNVQGGKTLREAKIFEDNDGDKPVQVVKVKILE